MGYVRPVYWYEGKDGKLRRDIESYEESGWRRQHAVTVWNAMAAVVMVAVAMGAVDDCIQSEEWALADSNAHRDDYGSLNSRIRLEQTRLVKETIIAYLK